MYSRASTSSRSGCTANQKALHDTESEMAVIGGMLVSTGAVDRTTKQLRPTDFVDEASRVAYKAVLQLKTQGHPIDHQAVYHAIRQHDAFRSGGCGYFLTQCCELGYGDGLQQHHIDRVRVASRLRRINDLADLARCGVNEQRSPESILTELDSAIDDLLNDQVGVDVSAADLFDAYTKSVLDREPPPIIYHASPYSDLAKFEFARGDVVVLGAPPGRGKTTLVNKIGFDALGYEGQENLRLSFCNVEMTAPAIFDKELSRRTGIGYSYIRHRDYSTDAEERVRAGLDILRSIMPRVSIMRPPFTVDRAVEHVRQHGADLAILDYLQRFTTEGEGDQRGQVDRAMDAARQLAAEGRAVIVVSAVSRNSNSKGNAYAADSMGLHSFRNSSELEYGADSAWLFLREPDSTEVVLKQVKGRFGGNEEIKLEFDGNTQQFKDAPIGQEWQGV